MDMLLLLAAPAFAAYQIQAQKCTCIAVWLELFADMGNQAPDRSRAQVSIQCGATTADSYCSASPSQ